MTITVLYHDEVLLAVDKPSGMLVHRGWAKDGPILVDEVRALLGVETVHPVHRLDRQTSGVVLFALNPNIAKAVAASFEAGTVEKTYWALVRGEAPESGEIDHPVPRTEGGPRVPAFSRFYRLAVLETEPRHTSWMCVLPKTGRFHQVRRHMKHIGHPIIGDANYGKGDLNRAFRDRYGLNRTALHAASLSLPHPSAGEMLTVSAALPSDLAEPLARMGLPRDIVR